MKKGKRMRCFWIILLVVVETGNGWGPSIFLFPRKTKTESKPPPFCLVVPCSPFSPLLFFLLAIGKPLQSSIKHLHNLLAWCAAWPTFPRNCGPHTFYLFSYLLFLSIYERAMPLCSPTLYLRGSMQKNTRDFEFLYSCLGSKTIIQCYQINGRKRNKKCLYDQSVRKLEKKNNQR